MEQIIYDGSYIGYLNAIESAIDENVASITASGKENLFLTNLYIETNKERAIKFENKIKGINPSSIQKIVTLYLSELDGFENIALGYVRSLYTNGGLLDNHLTDTYVYRANKIFKDVMHEVHRFMGFVRFSELEDGTMLAKISPKYNILPLIKNHFAGRLGNFRFIIYDETRKLAIVNTKEHCQIIFIPSIQFELSENEKGMRSLWKNFFQAIEIKERKNLKIQQSKVPSRYRKNMIEFIEWKK